jgi:hypothetical protein
MRLRGNFGSYPLAAKRIARNNSARVAIWSIRIPCSSRNSSSRLAITRCARTWKCALLFFQSRLSAQAHKNSNVGRCSYLLFRRGAYFCFVSRSMRNLGAHQGEASGRKTQENQSRQTVSPLRVRVGPSVIRNVFTNALSPVRRVPRLLTPPDCSHQQPTARPTFSNHRRLVYERRWCRLAK